MERGDVLADRYELTALLGTGGMGRVFRARDRWLERHVAVKLLAPATVGDAAARAQLRTEARLAASVRHPNVVQVLDALLDDEQPAIVLELVDGPALREVVGPHGMADVTTALRVVGAVGAGLAAAHAVGLVHRDVSPANVLLDRGVPRLTDFGIARAVAATATTTVRGSVGYLAPEQADGRAVGPPADVYGLACLATLLLTGRPPFEAEAAVGVVHQHLHAEPPDLRDRRLEVPDHVAEAVTAALAKDPAARPPDVAAFVAALGAAPADAPVVVLPTDGTGPTTGASTTVAGTVLGPGGTAVLGTGAEAADGIGEAADGGTTRRPHPADAASPSDDRRALLAGGVLVAVAAAALTWAVRSGGPVDVTASPAPLPVPTASPSPTRTPADSPPPSPSPSPSPVVTASPEEQAVAALFALRQRLLVLQGAEELSSKAVDKLDDDLGKALDELRDGEPDKARKAVRDARKEVEDLAEEGEVAAAAEDELLTSLLDLEARLEDVPPAEDRDEDDD